MQSEVNQRSSEVIRGETPTHQWYSHPRKRGTDGLHRPHGRFGIVLLVQLGPQEREEVLPLDAPDEGRNQMQSEVIRCNQWSSEEVLPLDAPLQLRLARAQPL